MASDISDRRVICMDCGDIYWSKFDHVYGYRAPNSIMPNDVVMEYPVVHFMAQPKASASHHASNDESIRHYETPIERATRYMTPDVLPDGQHLDYDDTPKQTKQEILATESELGIMGDYE